MASDKKARKYAAIKYEENGFDLYYDSCILAITERYLI